MPAEFLIPRFRTLHKSDKISSKILKEQNLMVSCEDLQKSVRSRDYARFWLDISESEHAEIDAFLESEEITPELRERVNHFQNLEMLPMGMAPNSKGLEELHLHFAFQEFRINIINCHDFVSESDKNSHPESAERAEPSVDQQLLVIKQEITKNIVNSQHSSASQDFMDLFFSILEKRLHLTLNSLSSFHQFDARFIQTLLLQTIQELTDYFLMQNIRKSSFFTRFVFSGFLFAEVDESVCFVYGLPSRRVFLDEIVFGTSATAKLRDLACDVIIERRNDCLHEVFIDEKAGNNVTLRASDTLKLMFSNDVEFRKSENFVPLRKIPCFVEIDFSKPRRNIIYSGSERSKRMKSKGERLLNLIEQLCSVVRDKIVGVDFSKVSYAVDGEILQLVSGCKNLQQLNLNNAGVSNSDFADCKTLPNLQILYVGGIEIDENGFNLVTLFPDLRILNSADSAGIIRLLAKCEPTPMLTQLDVSSIVINTDSELMLPKLDFLHTLIAQNCDFRASRFDFLRKFPSLLNFNLRECLFTVAALYYLSQNGKKLVSLDISVDKADMSLAGEDFYPISTMKELRYLKLSKRLISDSFISNLSSNAKKLISLDASFTMIGDVSMNYLSELRDLQEINLTGCKNITDSGIALLCESIMSLKNLSIRGTSVTEFGIAKVVNRFPEIKIDHP
ncbi:MAG: hypothetical protein K8S87_05595 [Planctomycetes bacterium]|nr:hypothetical protein [Planctomycetota bacterium]